jgi:hypothetical protein
MKSFTVWFLSCFLGGKDEKTVILNLFFCNEVEAGEGVYLAVEVSWGIGVEDVERATNRAEILRKFGFKVLPVVAGGGITPDVSEMAEKMRTYRVLDGP